MLGYVYTITANNLIIYVGSTKNYKKRCYEHKRNAKTINNDLYNDMNTNIYSFKVIEEYVYDTKTDLFKREQHFIDLLKPIYNKKKAYQTEKEQLINRNRINKIYFKTEKGKETRKPINRKYYLKNKLLKAENKLLKAEIERLSNIII